MSRSGAPPGATRNELRANAPAKESPYVNRIHRRWVDPFSSREVYAVTTSRSRRTQHPTEWFSSPLRFLRRWPFVGWRHASIAELPGLAAASSALRGALIEKTSHGNPKSGRGNRARLRRSNPCLPAGRLGNCSPSADSLGHPGENNPRCAFKRTTSP